MSLASVLAKQKKSVRFLSLLLFHLSVFYTYLTFKARVLSVSLLSQLRLIPTALTACFVKDEVI